MRRRSGFTLIELMVVITIIAILATVTLQVVGGLLSMARESATKSTISKLQGLLNSRVQAFDRLIKRGGFLKSSREYQYAGMYGFQGRLQEIVAIKLLQIKYFPQRSGDIFSKALFPNEFPSSGDVEHPDPLATPPHVFYDWITQGGGVIGDSPVGSDTFSSSETEVVNGRMQFKDAWGHPIRFYRWPTRLFRSGGQNTNGSLVPISTTDIEIAQELFTTLPIFTGNLKNDLARDPNDPLQDLMLGVNIETLPIQQQILVPDVNGRERQPSTVPYAQPVRLGTPATYHVMLIISAGPDGVLGLYEPDDVANLGHLGAVKDRQALTDDIVSLSIKAGGK